ncbi:MAG: DUF4258 domain-containing protein [Fimbriimonadaceae bacterium]
MSETLRRVQTLVLAGDVHISEHGFEELLKDGIAIQDVVAGIDTAVEVEDYPERHRGPSVLALQYDVRGRPVHVVWALPAGERRPAIIVTAYRPDPRLWDNDFIRRSSR